MKKNYLAGVVALLCVPAFTNAAQPIAEPSPGVGYLAKITFDADALKTGNDFSYVIDAKLVRNAATDQKTGSTTTLYNGSTAIASGSSALKSMSWNDDLSPTTSASGDPYLGWAMHAHWYLIDLTSLKGQKAQVHIQLKPLDDGQAAADETGKGGVDLSLGGAVSDDDLMPGLTVFKGVQSWGAKSHWFPNRHQDVSKSGQPEKFWANNLKKPLWPINKKSNYQLVGVNSGEVGYDTAYHEVAPKSAAEVEGLIKLDARDMSSNYITVAVGGDAHSPTTKHDVNYQLIVSVHKPHK